MNLKKLYNDKIEIFSEVKFLENFKKPGNECKHRTIKCRTIRCLSQKFYFKSPNTLCLLIDRPSVYLLQLTEYFHMKNNFFKSPYHFNFPHFLCIIWEREIYPTLSGALKETLRGGGDIYTYIHIARVIAS